ncbi:ribulose-phosphate 3-epimerase [Proteiniborus ethanoligenes]|uniref:Ribulose-phosphate 3-epimerase n=1 Tax=Proteiniborus ethanoligenes TaxID=415015 RepID=A0A1H3PKK9_9FIRM|nr:ribulose-phosphate 3-epimerase [Proteiniborus ethanoligenes]TAH64061.1 MAG: ribulose-phosphate 3-epimerase [Gottschalkiaceae bacterium]SDZ01732.1 ribulose-phosphate 3-epimerase [Proteiniborus ethanoligenes]
MIKIAPSVLSADFSRLEEQIKLVEEGGADYIHLDVMDGHFVPNITFGAPVIKMLRKVTQIPFDVHLMIENPDRYIKDFVDAGADIITVHEEASIHLHRTIQYIKSFGVKAGVALNPSTSIENIKYVIDEVDMVLIMTVNPGFGGQYFIEQMKEKIIDLKRLIDSKNLNIDIQVDGGIKLDNIKEIASYGANIFVAGSAIFNSSDITNVTRMFKNL